MACESICLFFCVLGLRARVFEGASILKLWKGGNKLKSTGRRSALKVFFGRSLSQALIIATYLPIFRSLQWAGGPRSKFWSKVMWHEAWYREKSKGESLARQGWNKKLLSKEEPPKRKNQFSNTERATQTKVLLYWLDLLWQSIIVNMAITPLSKPDLF